MISSINPIQKVQLGELQQGIGQSEKDNEFSAFLKNAVNELNATQQQADIATTALVTGQVEDFHTPVIAMEKASLSLGLAVTVRNKVLEAYQEIMRMQI